MADSGDKSHIYYGAIQLEGLQDRGKADKDQDIDKDEGEDILMEDAAAGAAAGGGEEGEHEMELSEAAQESIAKHQRTMQAFSQQQRAKAIAAPTQDMDVRKMLRQLGEPITLFGEGPGERRQRLKELLAKMEEEDPDALTALLGQHLAPPPPASALPAAGGQSISKPPSALVPGAAAREPVVPTSIEEQTSVFYTEGSDALKQARIKIAQYSVPAAASRLRRERLLRSKLDPLEYEESLRDYQTHLQSFSVSVSQVGDDRPLTGGSFAPNDEYLATCSWAGLVKLWRLPSCDAAWTFRCHTDRLHGVAWHPAYKGGTEGGRAPANIHIASGGADMKVMLWRVPEDGHEPGTVAEPAHTLEGHEDRINRVAFHPSGLYVGSTSHDLTWRLWDIHTRQELLLQEGHARGVYPICFHPDGSLAVTGDLGGAIWVWDMRTGKTVLPLKGHVKQVLSIDFNPRGCFELATASDDHTVRIWDLRKRKSVHTLLAHTKLVSDCKYEPRRGRFLLTSSYDCFAKLWHPTDWKCSKTLAGHEARIMAADISNSGSMIATVSFDRTWKLWTTAGEWTGMDIEHLVD
ncbi:unnamed protein product [Vitrella brassicaformis CCMP3155]|uniref:Pre-mRNA processing factor 4 (PRP4)-like domain-containing protein n=1 Tax=Vitrella brassicaformis (strain CCMP3155) TaxID=1169540 RepID=A0A0G4F7G2_VITBC|nr:unnamed protein product [Vitrella brassicaformis CCMP3155]|eukprot:CEM08608.1 unnamed protein product [Vitrella brassicaformis CCMP3155]